jgi:sugar lactone lactonase YvrE
VVGFMLVGQIEEQQTFLTLNEIEKMKTSLGRFFFAGLMLWVGNYPLFAQPIIVKQPVSQTVVLGGNATFNVMVTGPAPFTYQWLMNGTNLPNNVITTVAGGNLCDNQSATNTILASAASVAQDSDGNLYIADTANNVIRRVETNGVAVIIAGNGSRSFSGDGGAAPNAGLAMPNAVALDSMGNLFIADSVNNRIRKVDTNGVITTVAGNGKSIFSGDGGAATNAQISYPGGICLDAQGNLFIADTFNSRIRKVDTNGVITTVAGGGSGANPATRATLSFPYGIAVDSSNYLYIADTDDQIVRKVDGSGNISTVAGTGTYGYSGDGAAATSAKLRSPSGVTVDAAHNLFIADTGNNCIRMVGTNHIIITLAGNGTNGYCGDGGMATNANLSGPESVFVDNQGNLLIADFGNNRIRQLGTNGVITTVAGRRLNEVDFATNCTFNTAAQIAFDAVGNLYVADTYNDLIRKIDSNGHVTAVAGNGLPGYAGDSGAATNASLNQPSGVAFDTSGNMFIADTANYRIRKVDPNGSISTVAGTGIIGYSGDSGAATNARIASVYGIAVDLAGNCFIDDLQNLRIRKVATNGIITTAINGSGTLLTSFAVALDSGGNLIIADSNNNRVRNASLSTLAGNGVAGFSGDGGPATSASINFPKGLAKDTAGHLFIADSFNARIRQVNTNGIITTVAGTGTTSYSGDGGPANKATLSYPFGLALDTGGNLYFADSGNNRIRKLTYVDYADQPFFTVTNVTLANASNHYSVVITSASGSVTSSVVTLNLQLPPVAPAFTVSNGVCTFTWSAASNQMYQLQCATNLVAPVWQNLGSPVTATSNVLSATDSLGADCQRFYRVRLWP